MEFKDLTKEELQIWAVWKNQFIQNSKSVLGLAFDHAYQALLEAVENFEKGWTWPTLGQILPTDSEDPYKDKRETLIIYTSPKARDRGIERESER